MLDRSLHQLVTSFTNFLIIVQNNKQTMGIVPQKIELKKKQPKDTHLSLGKTTTQ